MTDFADYKQKLLDAFRAARRRGPQGADHRRGAQALVAAEHLELVDDPGLLDEVAGLAEWPTPILGKMDPKFLDLPGEVIRTSMRTHQKYFAVREPGRRAASAPRFLVVANIEAQDGGQPKWRAATPRCCRRACPTPASSGSTTRPTLRKPAARS